MKLKTLFYSTALIFVVGVAGCQNSGTKGDVKLTSKNDSASLCIRCTYWRKQ